MGKQHHSRRPTSHANPPTPSPQRSTPNTRYPTPPTPRALPPVKDEFEEREERQRARQLNTIALQHLEWAHERTRIAMEAGQMEAADEYSCTAKMWANAVLEMKSS